jgi:hypothetical protein
MSLPGTRGFLATPPQSFFALRVHGFHRRIV